MTENDRNRAENGQETRRGRPRRQIDPSGTAPLFLPDNSPNPIVADSYDDFSGDTPESGGGGQGTVRDGGARAPVEIPEYSDDALVRELWRIGHDPEAPAAARASALTRCAQVRERLGRRDALDVGAELSAFIALVRAERCGEVVTGNG